MAYGVTYSWPLHEILFTGSIAQAKSACNMIWSGLMMLCINTLQTLRQIRKGATQSKYSRHIYANPIEWVVYPMFYLGRVY